MQIPRGIGEVAGWGVAIWMAYYILKDPSLEEQCWNAARATRTRDPLGRDPQDKQLRLHEIERNINVASVEMDGGSSDLVRGCVYDACRFTRPKWTADTVSKLTVYIPRDRACERRGLAERESQ